MLLQARSKFVGETSVGETSVLQQSHTCAKKN